MVIMYTKSRGSTICKDEIRKSLIIKDFFNSLRFIEFQHKTSQTTTLHSTLSPWCMLHSPCTLLTLTSVGFPPTAPAFSFPMVPHSHKVDSSFLASLEICRSNSWLHCSDPNSWPKPKQVVISWLHDSKMSLCDSTFIYRDLKQYIVL